MDTVPNVTAVSAASSADDRSEKEVKLDLWGDDEARTGSRHN